jgi:hypothetical protein
VSPFLERRTLDESIRILVPDESLEGTNARIDLRWDRIEYNLSLSNSKRPFLSLMSFDTIESVYGATAAVQMYTHIGAVEEAGDIFVALTNPLLQSNERLGSLAGLHIKLDSLDGSTVLFGERPRTELFDLRFTWNQGNPIMELLPVV